MLAAQRGLAGRGGSYSQPALVAKQALARKSGWFQLAFQSLGQCSNLHGQSYLSVEGLTLHTD